MKRKPLNKSRFHYLKQNTPLNVVPEKKLKRADLGTLIENRGKSRFRTKRLRERIERLISIDLVFKNKTNAKPQPQQMVGTTLVPQARDSLKFKDPFHFNIHAKRTLHVGAAIPFLGLQQPRSYGSWCQATQCKSKRWIFSKSCSTKGFGSTLESKNCIYTVLEKNKSIKRNSLIGLCRANNWFVEGVADKSQHKRGFSSLSANLLHPYSPGLQICKRKAKVVCRCQGTFPLHGNARYIVDTASSKFHTNYSVQIYNSICNLNRFQEEKKSTFAEKGFIGTKYIVKRTALDSTRKFSNTRFKVHSQDLKQLIEGRGRRVSPYKARLLERKKLSLIYGNLGLREIRKCVLQSKHKKGVASAKIGNKKTRPQTTSFPENLITLLESRLDVVLYRCRFFPFFSSCKQAINHGKVFVNHRQVRIAGHLLKAGDVIQVTPQSKQSLLVQKGKPQHNLLQRNESIPTHSSVSPTTFKKGMSKAESAIFSEKDVSLLDKKDTLAYTFGNQEVCRIPIGTKTYLPFSHSARKEQEGVVSKKAKSYLSLENEKQKTLLYFQNKIKSRPFCPKLPSTLLTRFKPLHHFPLHPNVKPNQLNSTPVGCGTGQVYNKQDYGSRFLRKKRPEVTVPSTLKTFNRTNTPFSLNLEDVGKRLFKDLKSRKRILQNLSSMCNERLHGDLSQVNFKSFNTDRFKSGQPFRSRDNPSLFLRSQSKSGVESFKEHKCFKLARAATGSPVSAFTGKGKKGVNRLKRLSPPLYRAVKPLNLEVSYQTLTAIFLFPPQKVYFPAHIDLEMIGKSI